MHQGQMIFRIKSLKFSKNGFKKYILLHCIDYYTKNKIKSLFEERKPLLPTKNLSKVVQKEYS